MAEKCIHESLKGKLKGPMKCEKCGHILSKEELRLWEGGCKNQDCKNMAIGNSDYCSHYCKEVVSFKEMLKSIK